MSSYQKLTKNPRTGKEEIASWIDHGKDGYAVIFSTDYSTYWEKDLIKEYNKAIDHQLEIRYFNIPAGSSQEKIEKELWEPINNRINKKLN